MNKKLNLAISIVCCTLFLILLKLPVFSIMGDNHINGFEAFTLNFGRLFMVQSYLEYLLILATVLTNFFLLVLIIWSFKPQLKVFPLLIISIITFFSSLYWAFKYSDKQVLLYGYWLWVVFIITVIAFNFLKIYHKKK